MTLTKFIMYFKSCKINALYVTQEASQLHMLKKGKKMATCTKILSMHLFMHDRKSIYHSLILYFANNFFDPKLLW